MRGSTKTSTVRIPSVTIAAIIAKANTTTKVITRRKNITSSRGTVGSSEKHQGKMKRAEADGRHRKSQASRTAIGSWRKICAIVCSFDVRRRITSRVDGRTNIMIVRRSIAEIIMMMSTRRVAPGSIGTNIQSMRKRKRARRNSSNSTATK